MDQVMLDTMHKRNGTKEFDKETTITKEELNAILQDAMTAPSSFNLQHWNFIVFHSDEAKQDLLPIAFNQEKVTDSAATIAVLADLEANRNVDVAFDELVDSGAITSEVKQGVANAVENFYQNPAAARDTAFLNAGLVSMQIMLAAEARDYDTIAMGGFNGKAFKEAYDVSDRFEPVMLISIGKEAWTPAKTPRLAVEDVTTWK
ncbi:NAD(P)H nitroreductase [Pontibacillus halophilus JSM 076056 = DSM 19796]|uniref:NAD(P)H nitroreductase n=1 Tax=Pontibacillus halophilus JSM 076056 = DSM 19796 TaxID=1385510 RepID=A0A0A5GL41_9BACI|nr:nitroreductase family protein [Pontibacillus halophilus]KGX93976.1 NAD(P)H nitroreductase [Pontibacillus halophilus JSM 076056 = DSM 19796]